MWLEILINSTLAMAPVWASAIFGSALSQRFEFNTITRLAASVIFLGIFGYLGFLFSWLALLLNSEYIMVGFRLALLATVLLLIAKYSIAREILRLVLFSSLATLVAISTALCRGIADQTQGIQHTLAVRYWNSVDNKIPGIFANGLARKLPLRPEILDGWQSSDRPPIVTGLVRIFSPVTHSNQADFFIIVASSSVLLFAIVAVVRLIWNRTDLEYVIAAGTFFCPGIFINVVYTWPKIIAASLSIAAIMILLQSKIKAEFRIEEAYLATTAIVLAFLTHGSSAFALPPFALLFVFVVRKRTDFLKTFSLAILIYLPWFSYQRYWDPPGTRLLYWHLAGQLDGGKESILLSMWNQYQHLSISQLLFNKLRNFEAIFVPVDGNPAVSGYTGLIGSYRQLFSESVVGSVGIVGWLGLLVLMSIGIRRTDKNQRLFMGLLPVTVIPFCLIEYGDTFSTRSSLVVSPMFLSVALSIIAFAALIEYSRISSKLTVGLALMNIVFLGPLHPTAAAAGWGLNLWDIGTCILLFLSTLTLIGLVFLQINRTLEESDQAKFSVV